MMLVSDAVIEVPTRPMIRTVRRWGGCLAVSVPKVIAEIMDISEGDDVAVVILPLKHIGNGDDVSDEDATE